MPLADDTSTYDAADVETKASPDELNLWWARGIAAYYPYKVRMIDRYDRDGLTFLVFRLARNEALGPFKVELTQQTAYVWSDLPSTAQKATNARPYGFLMLSGYWEIEVQELLQEQNSPVVVHELREGGGKWPLSAEGDPKEAILTLKKPQPVNNGGGTGDNMRNLLNHDRGNR